jgi:hypothetical protein
MLIALIVVSCLLIISFLVVIKLNNKNEKSEVQLLATMLQNGEMESRLWAIVLHCNIGMQIATKATPENHTKNIEEILYSFNEIRGIAKKEQ